MNSSWIYHLYCAISKKCAERLLHIDLIGIGVMIFALALVTINTAFHAYPLARNNVLGAMVAICVFNTVIQMTPCYSNDEYECHRTTGYVVILLVLMGLSLFWYLHIATEQEIQLYTFRLIMSFVYLGIGFLFYLTKYPEKLF